MISLHATNSKELLWAEYLHCINALSLSKFRDMGIVSSWLLLLLDSLTYLREKLKEVAICFIYLGFES